MRLFVGIFPNTLISEHALAAARSFDLPAYRATAPEQAHLTVLFIGEVESRRLEETIESVLRSGAGLPRFDLTPTRLRTLPERGPSRLVALETDAPAPLLEFRSRLVRRLAKQARTKSNDRFLPHITVLRFRSPTRCAPIDVEWDGEERITVSSAFLIRSTLLSTGAVYERVAEVEFERA